MVLRSTSTVSGKKYGTIREEEEEEEEEVEFVNEARHFGRRGKT